MLDQSQALNGDELPRFFRPSSFRSRIPIAPDPHGGIVPFAGSLERDCHFSPIQASQLGVLEGLLLLGASLQVRSLESIP